ncbi:hypothetical protein Poli38472_002779 [Pythium oligandrum]|uniref:Uncharacterized protein n=1 Tax=Pythium oligandrum TaxID=41045 RepID=A0A8K1FMN5_PYTOL|nr:hypothetical protein Poli38472_002779 [Pythium oligandrum]|eukprot:TMW63838.1 hypothetical protein Poli38472_002779 [Pythium oligandrum]
MADSGVAGAGGVAGDDPSENAYEKLSREVHQMQITSAIHQEWLENPKGYLLKPDFKRRMQHVGAGGKKLNSSRVLRIHLPGNTYRKRWFVLDGMILRYFKSEAEDQELGEIHLTSVNAVLPSSIADAPEHALDLVCADRIYTIAGNDREDMVRWATVLTLVLRGEYKPKLMQRPESTIIRGSSVIPRISRKTAQVSVSRFTDANGLRMTSALAEDPDGKDPIDDLKEKIITVTFDQQGPLNLQLRGTVDDEVMVCGFNESPDGSVGLAEASGVIKIGDLLISINNHYFTNIEFQHAIDLIQNAGRPLTLRFSRIDNSAQLETKRVAEGWILAKEPAAHRYRIRMLQLHGTKLKLFKPSMQGGRADQPSLTLLMDEVTDIRPINDTREAVSAFTQCYPKQWGITLEGTRSIFTFYTRNREEMLQWVDLLKNCPLFSSRSSRLSIPVHPVATVEFNPVLEPKILMQDGIGKLGDLIPTFGVHEFMLLEDGKLMYYVDKQAAASRSRPIGTIRCDTIVSIVASYATENRQQDQRPQQSNFGLGSFGDPEKNEPESEEDTMPWRLELGIMVNSSVQRYRRSFTLCFENQEKMMKWGSCISREAKRLTGQEYNISSIARRASRSNSQSYAGGRDSHFGRPTVARVITNPAKYTDPNVKQFPPLYRSLKDVAAKTATKGWFFVKKPRSIGYESYHPRFVVLRDNELLFFKYEVDDGDSESAASSLNLRTIKDVRDAESGFQENLDFTIQLTTADDVVWMLVAESFAQKETWLSALIWISDYYFRGGNVSGNDSASKAALEKRAKAAGLMSVIPEADDEDTASVRESSMSDVAGPSPPEVAAQLLVSESTEMSGWLQIGGREVYATISNNVFSYYDRQEDHQNEWGDAIDAISLKQIEDVHSDGFQAGSFVVKVEGENEVQLVAESARHAKRWMLVMCSCGDLILKKTPRSDSWASTQPKEAWIWKLDRLYQVFRRRYFSLRNHQLIFSTEAGGRPLGMISLPCIFHLALSKVCTRSKDEADFYQLEISFAIPTTAEESSHGDQVGDFYALVLAFETEEMLRDWANAIYDCCTNSMSIQATATVPPLGDIQILPKELLKTFRFEKSSIEDGTSSTLANSSEFSASGWLYYRTAKEERVRLRYFVQWGYELSIYKHEVLADEATAIRYGVIDCRALVDVRFAYINSPENAVELVLGSGIRVVIIPRTDDEAVMWRNALLDVKRAYGYLESGKNKNDIFGSGVFISRGSTFNAQKDNEELLRAQIEASVIYSSNLQEWDGKRWIPKYFVLTTSRVLVMSLALHLYDEDPDILGSFASKDIVEVRSCSDLEEAEIGGGKATCVVTVKVPITSDPAGPVAPAATTEERYFLKCDSLDHCLEWMRFLCSTNNKLELKKNAATGLWGTVNRVASLSRHHSFMLTTPLTAASNMTPSASGLADRASRRLSRVDAAKRRTSELIMSRKMSTTTGR